MGNGYYAVASIKFDGMYDSRENPDKEDCELIRPIRDALFAFLETRENVAHMEVGSSVNGWSRFSISMHRPEDDGNGDPKLEISREPLPSGHTWCRWGVGIKRGNWTISIDRDPWPSVSPTAHDGASAT